MTMKPNILVRVLAVAVAFVCLAGLLPGCKSAATATAWVEEMPETEFEATRAKAGLVARVLAARLVREGAATPETIGKAADALEDLATDPASTLLESVLAPALKRAGLTSDEVLLAAVLIEDFVRSRVDLGSIGAPLGTRTRLLIGTVAGSLRAGAASVPTPEDEAEVEALVGEGS